WQCPAVALLWGAAVIAPRRGNKSVLESRVRGAERADGERASCGDFAGPGSGAVEKKFNRHADRRKPAILAVERGAALGALHDVDVEMILQILADAWQIMHHRNAARSQLVGRPDA